jgi:hypothetical protein
MEIKETMLMDIQLSVEQVGSDLIAHLMFCNNSDHGIYIDTWLIDMEDMFVNNVFKIYDESNNKASYLGLMARRDIVPEDFVAVAPGEKLPADILINKGYKLFEGKKYTIQYYAHNPSYPGVQHLMDLQSNKVEILYQ